MLSAIVTDFLQSPGVTVYTTCDHRLPLGIPIGNDRLTVESISSLEAELSAFDRLAELADVTLIIAPETDGVLKSRVGRAAELGVETANCSLAAIDLCGDKWQLFRHLNINHLPTIPSEIADFEDPGFLSGVDMSCVLKPRFGAGSWLMCQVSCQDQAAWDGAAREYQQVGISKDVIIQPLVVGQSLSVGCLCQADGSLDVFPIGLQSIAQKSFQYMGGQIPATIAQDARVQIENLIRKAYSTIPGLRGYVGFDVMLPHDHPLDPLIIEINPRLTTSYVGYRQLCRQNLAARILESRCSVLHHQKSIAPLLWKPAVVSFRADGEWSFIPSP